MPARRRIIVGVAVLLALMVGVVVALATYYTEFLWFADLGFGTIFTTRLLAQLALGVGFGAVALAVLGAHLVLIRRFSEPRPHWRFSAGGGQIVELDALRRRMSSRVVAALATTVAIVLGAWAAGHWEAALQLLHHTPFGEREPILGQDVGFYLFVLPMMQFAQQWLIYLAGLCGGLVVVVYLVRGAIGLRGRHLDMDPRVRGHLLAAIAAVLLVVAWGWRLEMFEILFSRRGVAHGATYTDVHANLVFYRIMIAACIGVALFLLALIGVRLSGTRATTVPAATLGGLVVAFLLGSFVWPALVQRLAVAPNELDRERPYLINAIAGTRRAYGLDRIEVKQFPAGEQLTAADLAANAGTIDNIRIWDDRPLRATYKQVQAMRLYYDFPSISVDRYRADGRYFQVMLAARELVIEQLPQQSQTWVNRHLQYTHGYGVCLSPVKRVVGEGLPDLWIKDIPPESRYPHLAVTRPEIYFGLQTSDYALVRTRTKEFDYPRGTENAYTTYGGQGGVGIGSLWRRLLFAIRFADLSLPFTGYLSPESRVLFNRQVPDRVLAVAPFLRLDSEPYMVVADGRLFWIQDAYTVSHRYPYSQPSQLRDGEAVNYIRNSVKVVVDAYHGTTRFYLWDEQDPVARTYAKIFPDLFTSRDAMPAAVRDHVRYPKDLFAIQATMYESFHMTDPQVFYNQEDKWAVSRELGEKTRGRQQETREQQNPTAARSAPLGDERGGAPPAATVPPAANRMDPSYMIMRLPEERREEFLLMVPFTPSNKDNMVAWMTARCDADRYGTLLVYTFPKKKLVFGPMQIEARIDQDERISEWITLRNQQGSIVIRGDLLVLPIKDAILFVEPIYLQSTQTKLPELKGVVVAFGKRVTMKETLPEALREVFGEAAGDTDEPTGQPAAPAPPGHAPGQAASAPQLTPADATLVKAREQLQRAVDHFRAGRERMAVGDWAGYGAAQKELEATLARLAQTLEVELRPMDHGQGHVPGAPRRGTPPAPLPTPAPAPTLPR